jgi:DNA ligase (NAD+)
MKKSQIELQYKKKIKLLTEYNKNYFDKNNPIVDDNDYDKLKNEILLLEKNYNFLFSKNSPSKKIGYKPSKNFKKVSHRIPYVVFSKCFWKRRFN